jgi:hypothetical protein
MTLNLEINTSTKSLLIDGCEEAITVKQYLPVEEKSEFIRYIAENALDELTGSFSPIRVEIYYGLAIVKYYTDLEIEETPAMYDILETNKIFDKILALIPQDERDFLSGLVSDTIDDIARYNNSFAGIIAMASNNAGTLNEEFGEILEKIKDKEGIQLLSDIKDVV